MFESDLDSQTTHVGTAAIGCPAEQSSAAPPPNIQRRTFLATAFATIVGLVAMETARRFKRRARRAPRIQRRHHHPLLRLRPAPEKSRDREGPQDSRPMASTTRSRRLRHHAQRRHRNRLHRKILEPARQRTLPLHLLRQRPLRFRHEIRIRHRMAEFLSTHRCRERNRNPRHDFRHSPHRSFLHRMRRAPRPRLRRRPRTHRPALLHELRLVTFPETDIARSKPSSAPATYASSETVSEGPAKIARRFQRRVAVIATELRPGWDALTTSPSRTIISK